MIYIFLEYLKFMTISFGCWKKENIKLSLIYGLRACAAKTCVAWLYDMLIFSSYITNNYKNKKILKLVKIYFIINLAV